MGPAPARRFRFGRSIVEARDGETLLGALARRGWPSLTRSVRYHRPRGPFCGVGDCTQCLVRVNGVPNVRSCRYVVAAGDVARTENSWPSPRLDGLGLLDLLLPHGVDTVHGLRRPAWAVGLYQRVGRRLAGFGRAPASAPAARPPHSHRLAAEVAVVGAGRAGRTVAEALARRGIRVIVLERRRAATSSGEGIPPLAGAELWDATTVTILPPPDRRDGARIALVGFRDDGDGLTVRARAVVVATGAYDGGLLFEGSDRPGVVTADLALSALGLPLGEIVVVGGGTRARQVLERYGRSVRGVVAPEAIDPDLTRAAVDLDVPLYPRSRVVRSVGRAHLRAVQLARRDGGGSFLLRCRTLVLAHRRLPNAQLAFQAGASRRWFDAPGAYYPEVDRLGRTGVPGVFAVGSAALPPGAAAPTADQVAVAISGDATEPPSLEPAPAAPSAIVPYYRELLRERRRAKWVVCPCEDVLLEELERASARGYRGLEVIMRYTGVGTGLCQGRYCLPEATVVLAVLEGRSPPEVGYVTQRPPLVPTPLGALAAVGDEFGGEAAP